MDMELVIAVWRPCNTPVRLLRALCSGAERPCRHATFQGVANRQSLFQKIRFVRKWPDIQCIKFSKYGSCLWKRRIAMHRVSKIMLYNCSIVNHIGILLGNDPWNLSGVICCEYGTAWSKCFPNRSPSFRAMPYLWDYNSCIENLDCFHLNFMRLLKITFVSTLQCLSTETWSWIKSLPQSSWLNWILFCTNDLDMSNLPS